MKRRFRYRKQFGDWINVTADRCDVLLVAAGSWVACEEIKQEQP